MSCARASSPAPLAALLAALLILEGCASWHPAAVAPDSLVRMRPAAVRLQRRGGWQETLLSPQFTADSIVGRGEPGQPARIAVAFSDVEKIEVAKLNEAKTAGAGVGIAFGMLAVAAAIALASWDGPFGR